MRTDTYIFAELLSRHPSLLRTIQRTELCRLPSDGQRSLDQQEGQALQDCLRAWKADRESHLADVVRKVHRQSDQDLVQIMGRFGFRKQPRGWIRLPVATGEKVAVQASNGQSARPVEEHGPDETDVAAKRLPEKAPLRHPD